MPEDIAKDRILPCRGEFAKLSAYYTPTFAKVVWSALRPQTLLRPCCPITENRSPVLAVVDPPPLPLWCCLVTRQVSLKSKEAQLPEAVPGIQKEKCSHERRGTWDLSSVREYGEWMRDPHIPEAVFRRIFTILGRRNDEVLDGPVEMKARSVFQGNNVRIKSGRSPHEIFEEISECSCKLHRCQMCHGNSNTEENDHVLS